MHEGRLTCRRLLPWGTAARAAIANRVNSVNHDSKAYIISGGGGDGPVYSCDYDDLSASGGHSGVTQVGP